MADLIERLRLQAKLGMFDTPPEHKHVGYGEAADALERQSALLAEAREALLAFGDAADIAERIVGHDGPLDPIVALAACRRARSVLKSLEAEGGPRA